mgnify:CR=1 FL=1
MNFIACQQIIWKDVAPFDILSHSEQLLCRSNASIIASIFDNRPLDDLSDQFIWHENY